MYKIEKTFLFFGVLIVIVVKAKKMRDIRNKASSPHDVCKVRDVLENLQGLSAQITRDKLQSCDAQNQRNSRIEPHDEQIR